MFAIRACGHSFGMLEDTCCAYCASSPMLQPCSGKKWKEGLGHRCDASESIKDRMLQRVMRRV